MGRTPVMQRLMLRLAVVAVLVVIAGACGNDDDAAPDTTATGADPTTTTTEAETTTTEVETTPVSVYFFDGEELKVGYVRQAEGLGVAAEALEALLAGPNGDDEALGLHTEIPDGTELLGVDIVDNQATVDLSGEFESGGGTLSMSARLAQVVFTTSQFPSVDEVVIHLDGEPAETLGGEGLMIADPLTRADFEFEGDIYHLTPAILIETPRPGEEVRDSIRVTGRSNTFEAALYFEIVDSDGDVVVEETYAMATSGTGTPGDFDETLELPDDTPESIVLLAYDLSARDGSRVGITEVPLTVG
ncbi:MAG: Gmad2 immunoglobulin-like domain-containing protein [Acidimicrobiales bacterium]|nr:Gmad2 immunoglobulin-like domain-containing protein [Acidimicrobiales bacterium]